MSARLDKVTVRLAQSAEDLDATFKARYRVFVENEGYMAPNTEARLYDRFDAFPTTAQVVALAAGRAVGGLRLTAPSPAGTSPQDAFDFTPWLPPGNVRYGTASWLYVDENYRDASGVCQALWTVGYAWALERNWSHLFCVANPSIMPTLQRNGFRALGETRYDNDKQLPFVPIELDLRQLPPPARERCELLRRKRAVRDGELELLLA